MNIHLIRHGETDSNYRGSYYGQTNIALNNNGIKQMKRLKPQLDKIKYDFVYSSDLIRALESLRICGEDLYKMAIEDIRLREINFGEFENMTYKEISSLYPELITSWEDDWINFCPPGGESFLSFYKRVISFWQELLKKDTENILIMAHSGTIKAIICHVLGDNPNLFWNFKINNATINIIKYEYGNLYIEGINKEFSYEGDF